MFHVEHLEPGSIDVANCSTWNIPVACSTNQAIEVRIARGVHTEASWTSRAKIARDAALMS